MTPSTVLARVSATSCLPFLALLHLLTRGVRQSRLCANIVTLVVIEIYKRCPRRNMDQGGTSDVHVLTAVPCKAVQDQRCGRLSGGSAAGRRRRAGGRGRCRAGSARWAGSAAPARAAAPSAAPWRPRRRVTGRRTRSWTPSMPTGAPSRGVRMQVPACCDPVILSSARMRPFVYGMFYEAHHFPMGEANTAVDLSLPTYSLHKVTQCHYAYL